MTAKIEFRPRTVSLTSALLPEGGIEIVQAALNNTLVEMPTGFFNAVGIIADCQNRDYDESYLKGLINIFSNAKLSLIGLSHHHFPIEMLAKYGLADIASQPIRQQPPLKSVSTEVSATIPAPITSAQTKVHRGNVRSGQRLYAAGGDLIIIGIVSAGAEVIADGNIHILGSLRGRAFAGAQGNAGNHIFTTEMSAQMVAISGIYLNMETLEQYRGGKNCIITLNPDETMLVVAL